MHLALHRVHAQRQKFWMCGGGASPDPPACAARTVSSSHTFETAPAAVLAFADAHRASRRKLPGKGDAVAGPGGRGPASRRLLLRGLPQPSRARAQAASVIKVSSPEGSSEQTLCRRHSRPLLPFCHTPWAATGAKQHRQGCGRLAAPPSPTRLRRRPSIARAASVSPIRTPPLLLLLHRRQVARTRRTHAPAATPALRRPLPRSRRCSSPSGRAPPSHWHKRRSGGACRQASAAACCHASTGTVLRHAGAVPRQREPISRCPPGCCAAAAAHPASPAAAALPASQALLGCHVLDTPAERRYDAICRLLCSVFKASGQASQPAAAAGRGGRRHGRRPACG